MSIGESLADARRQAGLTITQVSRETRIRESIIRDIVEHCKQQARPEYRNDVEAAPERAREVDAEIGDDLDEVLAFLRGE